MAVSWSPRLSVGVDSIDAQHRELFHRVDALLEAMAAGRGRAHVEETFEFLDRYVEQHFADELTLMRKCRYPLVQQHLALHDHFAAELRKLKATLAAEGEDGKRRVTVRAGFLLVEWLRTHVGTSDRDFGQYLATHADVLPAHLAPQARLPRA